MNKDIFDLKSVEDLPEDVLKNITKKRNYLKTNILNLFDIKDMLNVNEIIIGLYRKHNIILKRSQVVSCLTSLKVGGYLERVKDSEGDVYKRVKIKNIR